MAETPPPYVSFDKFMGDLSSGETPQQRDHRIVHAAIPTVTGSPTAPHDAPIVSMLALEDAENGPAVLSHVIAARPDEARPTGPCMSEDAYRSQEGMTEGFVSAAIAAGVALESHVPFSELLVVNRKAQEAPTSGFQIKQLLENRGATVASALFLEMLGLDSAAVAAALQDHLDSSGHHAAVLLFAANGGCGDPIDPGREHCAAIYRAGSRWMLHDATADDGRPRVVSMAEIVGSTFGRNTAGSCELEVHSFGGGMPLLRVDRDFSSAATDQFRVFMRDRRITPDLLPPSPDGRGGDWRKAARDMVAICNVSPPRSRTASEAVYEQVPTPAWCGARSGTWDITLTLAGDRVTAIKLSNLRVGRGPTSERPPAQLVMDPLATPIELGNALRLYLRQHFTALYDALPHHAPDSPIDWAAVCDKAVAACSQSWNDPVNLGLDEIGRRKLEYPDVELFGQRANVQLRFSNLSAGVVWDLRIYAAGSSEPPFRWDAQRS